MNQRNRILILGLAVALVAGVGGIFIGRALDGGPPAAGHEEKEKHAEAEGGEGFVAMAPAEARAAGVELATVVRGGGGELIVPGRVAFAPGAEAEIGAPLAGRVEAVHVAPGRQVAAGTPLVTLRSADGAALHAAAASAHADAEAAGANYRRETTLFAERVTARQDLEAARAASLRASAAARAAQAQFAAQGAPDAAGRVTVRAPMAGTVTVLTAAPGAVLAAGGAVARIADQGRVELVFDAPASMAATIRPGTAIVATAAGGREVRAIVTAVAPNAVDAGAQVRARIEGEAPPPGTPLSGRLLIGSAGGLIVPSDAIQTVEGRQVVFVAEGRGFRARPVVIGRTASGRTEILRRLREGERVAGRGAFLLKAELSRGEAEHEH